jgi:DNA-binding transcriptional regulator YiaG
MEGISFVEHIEALIDKEGVTALANRLNVTRQTIYNWRKGEIKPSLAEVERLGGFAVFPAKEG